MKIYNVTPIKFGITDHRIEQSNNKKENINLIAIFLPFTPSVTLRPSQTKNITLLLAVTPVAGLGW